MHEIIPFIKDLAIMLGVASVVVLLFQKIRQPVILGYLLAGVIIGPHTPPYSFVSDINQIKVFSELGVIFLMFALGLEFSFHRLKRVGFSAVVTGLVKVFSIMILGFVVGWFMGWSFYNCFFFGAALGISSTMIIVKAVEELKLKGRLFADIVFGVLIVEDLIAILILTSLSMVAVTRHFLSIDMMFGAMQMILVVGLWFVSGYFLVPILFKKIIKYVSQETLTIVSIALCLLMAVLASYFNYSIALGAFIMGSLLSETPLSHRIRKLTMPLRDVFAAVFFISVGMLINIKMVLINWPIILLVSAVIVVYKIIITSVTTFLTGQSLNTSLRAGFSMAPVGEFSFIIMAAGISLNLIGDSLYQIIVGVAAVTTLMAPYLMRLSGSITKKLDATLSVKTKHLLESYSAWVYKALTGSKKQAGYRRYAFRLLLNGMIVAVIFNLVRSFVFPRASFLIFDADVAKIASWIVAILFSSPFVWGMLFGFRSVDEGGRVSALFLGWTITIFEIFTLSIFCFGSWYIPVVVSVMSIVVFWASYEQLGKSYAWFERNMAMVLRKRHYKRNKYEELAPWDTQLVEVVVTNEKRGSMVGKTLNRNKVREKFGVNIVAIRRGSKMILAPRGNEKILLLDGVLVLGKDEQVDAFRQAAEDHHFDPKKEDILKDFSLRRVLIERGSPFVGKSIRESNIREEVSGVVVGLEREGFRILNPDPSMNLKSNDLLLVVGKAEICDFSRAVSMGAACEG